MEETWEFAVVNSFERIAQILQLLHDVKSNSSTTCEGALHMLELPESVTGDEELYDFEPRHILRALYVYIDKADQEIFTAVNLSAELIAVGKSKLFDVENLLSSMLSGSAWHTVRSSYLPQSLIDSIRLTGGMLGASGVKYELSSQEVKQLIAELVEITDGIKHSGIPEQLKQMLLASLLKIRFLLETYDSLGPRDLEVQIKNLVADTVLGAKQVDEEDAKELSKAWDFAGKILRKFHTGVGYIKSSEYAIGLLMLLGKGSAE